MKRSYLDYAMSVIVSRALPDARDGLKPVHRRILFSMHENGHTPDKKYVKSARVVGDVMGKYHPHGDQAIYDALVRMAQDFSMRLPLIDGQGNYGSVDGDPPAAMRYTECRLADSAMSLLADIDKDTVDFQANYDGNEHEPVVLPARVPESSGQWRRRHRRRHGDQHPAAQSRRGDRRLRRADRQSGARHRGADRHHPRSGFPDRRRHPRPSGHPRGLSHRPRLDRHARQGRDRDAARRSRGDHHQRDSLPGEQGRDGRAHRGALAREEDRRHFGAARRIRPPGLSRGGRAQARGRRRHRPQPALPLHRPAKHLRRQHGGARRRPSAGDER